MGISLKWQFNMSNGFHFPLIYAMNREVEIISLCSEAAAKIQV